MHIAARNKAKGLKNGELKYLENAPKTGELLSLKISKEVLNDIYKEGKDDPTIYLLALSSVIP